MLIRTVAAELGNDHMKHIDCFIVKLNSFPIDAVLTRRVAHIELVFTVKALNVLLNYVSDRQKFQGFFPRWFIVIRAIYESLLPKCITHIQLS